MKEIDFSAKAEEIMALAEENGVDDNFLFVTTFDRYLTQLTILAELKKKIDEEGVLAEKEYVKGTKNMYAHPAVAEYNKTTDSSNKTVSRERCRSALYRHHRVTAARTLSGCL